MDSRLLCDRLISALTEGQNSLRSIHRCGLYFVRHSVVIDLLLETDLR